MDTAELTRAFGAFFAILTAFMNLPIFMGVTAGCPVGNWRSPATKNVLFPRPRAARSLWAAG